MTYHSVQDWSCLHLPSRTSRLVVRRVFIVGGLDVGVVIFYPLYPQPATCRTLVPSLVSPELTVRMRLVVVVHVVMHLLPLLIVVLVVLLPVKNLSVLLTIQPARMSSLLESMYMSQSSQTLTCVSQRQSRTEPLTKAVSLQIGVQLYLAGGTQQHKNRLEGTSSYRSHRRTHTCCSNEKEVPHLNRTAPTPPTICTNKMLDGILIHFKPAWEIKFTYTRCHEHV